MKNIICLMLLVCGTIALADVVPAVSASASPAVQLLPTATIQPQAPVSDIPGFLLQLMQLAQSLPIVGPYLIKLMQYLGLLASITTTLCATVISVIKVLQTVSSAAGLQDVSNAVEKFENGPVVYYMKYASIFNAQKTQTPAPSAAQESVQKVG